MQLDIVQHDALNCSWLQMHSKTFRKYIFPSYSNYLTRISLQLFCYPKKKNLYFPKTDFLFYHLLLSTIWNFKTLLELPLSATPATRKQIKQTENGNFWMFEPLRFTIKWCMNFVGWVKPIKWVGLKVFPLLFSFIALQNSFLV